MPHCYSKTSGYDTQANQMFIPPEPVKDESSKRESNAFKIPDMTVVQIVILGLIIAYMYSSRSRGAQGMVLAGIMLAIGLYHMYDHLYRVKRGPEHLFFLPKKESYGGCKTCNM